MCGFWGDWEEIGIILCHCRWNTRELCIFLDVRSKKEKIMSHSRDTFLIVWLNSHDTWETRAPLNLSLTLRVSSAFSLLSLKGFLLFFLRKKITCYFFATLTPGHFFSTTCPIVPLLDKTLSFNFFSTSFTIFELFSTFKLLFQHLNSFFNI